MAIWPVAVVRGGVRVHADVGYLAVLPRSNTIGNERLSGSPATEETPFESFEDCPQHDLSTSSSCRARPDPWPNSRRVRRLSIARALIVRLASHTHTLRRDTQRLRRNTGRVSVLCPCHGGVAVSISRFMSSTTSSSSSKVLTRLEWRRRHVFVVGIVVNL